MHYIVVSLLHLSPPPSSNPRDNRCFCICPELLRPFLFFSFFLFSRDRGIRKFSEPGIESVPQQRPEPLQWQCQILNHQAIMELLLASFCYTCSWAQDSIRFPFAFNFPPHTKSSHHILKSKSITQLLWGPALMTKSIIATSSSRPFSLLGQ